MANPYAPISAQDWKALGILRESTSATGTCPVIPIPLSFDEMIDTLNKLIARLSCLIQAQDGLSIEYTIRGHTATAERFMLGPDYSIEAVGAVREILALIEAYLNGTGSDTLHLPGFVEAFAAWHTANAQKHTPELLTSPTADNVTNLLELSLEKPEQFAMSWTTFQDIYRNAYPHRNEFVQPLQDPVAATKQFWPLLAQTALPYNLLVLQKLSSQNVAPFQANFQKGWEEVYGPLLGKGLLYGIDMTIFSGLSPAGSGENIRFTPNTMTLLAQNPADKSLAPIAVFVADPLGQATSQIYTPASPAWNYALLAAKTSLTVYGVWLGHVYIQHIVTAAMQMTMFNNLPPDHPIYLLLAPQSKYLIPFDLVLLLDWAGVAPPTSLDDPDKFLTLANTYSQQNDFLSTDPPRRLKQLNLDATDFTRKDAWDLYPNVANTLRIWETTSDYVDSVVDVFYKTDEAVQNDTPLQQWIKDAANTEIGNVQGLPSLNGREALKEILTSILYRINFHGSGRLTRVANPDMIFVPNYPPCLQKDTIPDPSAVITVEELLTYLPKTGTIGKMMSFYGTFGFTQPYEPLIPDEGPETNVFFGDNTAANEALITFRQQMENFITTYQPGWFEQDICSLPAQIGQWPMSIET